MSARIALVTGAARGIGAAIVRRFLADGFIVVAADRAGTGREPPVRERQDHDCDVTDAKVPILLAEEVRARFGRLDCLVNNAGVFARTPLTVEGHADAEARIMAVNAQAPMAMIADFETLLEQGSAPAIVNIASVRGLTASENAAAYSISKALVIDLTRRAAQRLSGRIRVNAIAPGDIDTGMSPTEPAILQKLMARIPLGRFGKPDEVAHAVAFQASDRARSINGAVLPVDGGFLCT